MKSRLRILLPSSAPRAPRRSDLPQYSRVSDTCAGHPLSIARLTCFGGRTGRSLGGVIPVCVCRKTQEPSVPLLQ